MRVTEKTVVCGHCHKTVQIKTVMSQRVQNITIDGNTKQPSQFKAVQVCPECGYVALDIQNYAKDIVDGRNTDLYTRFMSGAKTYALNGNDTLASYMYRLASFYEDHTALQHDALEKSAKALDHYLDHLKTFNENDLYYGIILADMYRQLERCSDAKELLEDVKSGISKSKATKRTDYFLRIIDFEMRCIENKDHQSHFTSEV